MTKIAIGYARVSTLAQSLEGVSLEAQQERIEAYCKLAGLELAELVIENGVSGSMPLAKRPGGSRLCESVKAHKATAIVALKLDRLFRNTIDALTQVEKWEKKGISLHLIDLGGMSISTDNSMGKMFLTMLSGFGEMERNLTAERTRTALAHKRKKGQVFNHPPLGFNVKGDRLVPNKKEQKLVREIFAMRAEGMNPHRIAITLNEKGVRGKNRGKFQANTIQKILGNPLFADLSQ